MPKGKQTVVSHKCGGLTKKQNLRHYFSSCVNSVFVYINSIYVSNNLVSVDKNPVSVDENKSLSQQTKKAGFTTSLLFDGRNVRKDICRIGVSACCRDDLLNHPGIIFRLPLIDVLYSYLYMCTNRNIFR